MAVKKYNQSPLPPPCGDIVANCRLGGNGGPAWWIDPQYTGSAIVGETHKYSNTELRKYRNNKRPCPISRVKGVEMKGWSCDKGSALFEWNPNGASCIECEKSGILEFLATLANPSVFPAKSQVQHFPKYFKAKPPKHWWSLLGSSVLWKLLQLNM